MNTGAQGQDSQPDYTKAGGAPSNASFTGEWIPLYGMGAIGFQAVMPNTGAPNGTFSAEITDDEDPVNNPILGATPLPALTGGAVAGGPVNAYFNFDPRPSARWMRLKYTFASGGSASKVLQIGAAWRRVAKGQ